MDARISQGWQWLVARLRGLAVAQQLALVGAVLGAAAATALAGWALWAISTAAARRALRAALFVFRVLSFSLYRRCPDCHSLIHADARVCVRCRHRTRASPPGLRAR